MLRVLLGVGLFFAAKRLLSQPGTPHRSSAPQSGDLNQEPVQTGGTPSPQRELYMEMSREVVRNRLPFINEVLRSLLTLNATLLGGSIVLLDPKTVGYDYRNASILFFFFSLVAAFLGVMPYSTRLSMLKPNQIQRELTGAFQRKRFFLILAGAFLSIGLGAAFFGLISNGRSPFFL
jgi:hypothetical protein